MALFNEKPQICGLGMFARDAAKAGYRTWNGKVNLLEANYVCQKYGELVPKWKLDKETRQELKEMKKAFEEKNKLSEDAFIKR